MSELHQDILNAFNNINNVEYLIYPNEAGKTLGNLIAEHKGRSFEEGVLFTLEYLNNKGKLKQ